MSFRFLSGTFQNRYYSMKSLYILLPDTWLTFLTSFRNVRYLSTEIHVLKLWNSKYSERSIFEQCQNVSTGVENEGKHLKILENDIKSIFWSFKTIFREKRIPKNQLKIGFSRVSYPFCTPGKVTFWWYGSMKSGKMTEICTRGLFCTLNRMAVSNFS